MAVSPDDEIYVVDVLNTRAQVFDRNGQFLVTVGSWGVTQGQLFRPKGVALTKNRRILVSDSYLGVVQLYSSDTRFQGVLAMQGDIARFTTPVGMAVDSRNRIYIAEAMANRVSICQLAI
jgi:sugar lactone lactonase YvrE